MKTIIPFFFLVLIIPNYGFSQGIESIQEYLEEVLPLISANKYLIDAERNLDNGNLSNALSYYDDAINVFPQYDRAYINRGKIKMKMGNFEDAISDFSLSIVIKPNILFDENSLFQKFLLIKNAEKYYYRGHVYSFNGDLEKANSDLLSSREISDRTYEHLQQNIKIDELILTEIKNHLHYLHQKPNSKFEITNRVNLLRNNPTFFNDYISPGDLVQYDDVLEFKINELYESESKFRDLLYDKKITEFDQILRNIFRNREFGIFAPSLQPEIYAKSFAIYNRFGSETLKDYTNIIRYYDPNAIAQDNRVISAFRRFMKSPQFQDVGIIKYAKKFTRSN